MILIISHAKDEHSRAVLGELTKLGAEARLLDLSDAPQHVRLAVRFDGARARSFQLPGVGVPSIDLDTCGAVWWRRPQAFTLHSEITDPRFHTFAFTEATEAFTGLWQALDVCWVNPPANDASAHHKLYQLRVAQDVGLTIPSTLITNDPAQARSFIETHGVGRTIYKAFSGTREAWRETRLVKPEELALLDSVRFAPVIFQSYIGATIDLRVTIVGEKVFPAALYSQQSAYPIDFRMDMVNTRIAQHQIPDGVKAKLQELMRKLGLVYGAIDMRLTPEGEYVFLEVNPAGQWLFIESHSAQRITAEIAAYLVGHDRYQR